MTQNRSSAVMQRRSEAPDSLDDFPTPPWATRALCEHLVEVGQPLHLQQAWDPACNRGYMVRPLGEYFDRTFASDVHDYGWDGQAGVVDFLIDWAADAPHVDFVITNPPFRLAPDFIRQALDLARVGVAMLVRNAFDEGANRYRTLFRDMPETWNLPFVERVVMWQGVLLDPDVPVWQADEKHPNGGRLRKPSSATAYKWLVWIKSETGGETRLRRIPPCRRTLTRPGDYPPVPARLRAPEGGLL